MFNERHRVLIAGVDEAGRGPLAGPVVAAAVILDPRRPIPGLADSKILTESARERLCLEIHAHALAYSAAWADPAEIDAINILQASLLAMRRAIMGLNVRPTEVQVDGNRLPNLNFYGYTLTGTAIVGGDAKVAAISAASIIAKTVRDDMMRQLDRQYPGYHFATHKGYPTALHRQRIEAMGPCCQHRMSFAPMRLAQ